MHPQVLPNLENDAEVAPDGVIEKAGLWEKVLAESSPYLDVTLLSQFSPAMCEWLIGLSQQLLLLHVARVDAMPGLDFLMSHEMPCRLCGSSVIALGAVLSAWGEVCQAFCLYCRLSMSGIVASSALSFPGGLQNLAAKWRASCRLHRTPVL